MFEATIINTLMAYWGYDQSPAIMITVSLLLYLALNIYRADVFGEAECEYWVHLEANFSLARAGQGHYGYRADLLHLYHYAWRQPAQ